MTPFHSRQIRGWAAPVLLGLLLLAGLSGAASAEPAPDEARPAVAAPAAGGSDPAPSRRQRPRWVWLTVLVVLAGAGATPVVARRTGRRRPALPVAAALGLTAVGLLLATSPRRAGAAGEAGREARSEPADSSPLVQVSAAAAQALGFQTETVAPAELAVGFETNGRIVPVEARQAHLGPRLAGRVTTVGVRVGDRVAAGQVVATLDSVDAAQAAAAWREAVARLAAAQRTLASRRQLVASGSVTAGPLEEERRRLADARVEQAKTASELAQARNEAEAARAELGRTERLVASGTFTTAAVDDASQRLADAKRALAEARNAVAAAEADSTEAANAVELAQGRLAGAKAIDDRTTRLAATGELDRAPLELAQNALADARARLQQAEAGLEQARRQAQRGEELHRAELISLNDLDSRRTSVRDREAQRQSAATAVANAQAAVQRQEHISGARMTSGRVEQEARNSVAAARQELAAAEARWSKAKSRVQVVGGSVAPAQAAVDAAASALQRERGLAGDQTRAQSALEAGRLRVAQAERTVQGKQGEVTQTGRKVQGATAAVAREQRLAAGQVRAREQLLEVEREVRAAQIVRDNAGEVLGLLGASTAAATGARGPVQIPIRSPLAGLVTAITASVGEAVSAEKELLSVVDLSEVYVEADVYEQDLPRVQPGLLTRVRVRSFPGEVFLGSVVSISGQLDPQTRAAHVRALLANPRWRLRPEMFADVGFVTDRHARVLTVATSAVQEIEQRKVVFVQRSPEQYETCPVTLGRTAGERVEVLSGLRAGAVVVTEGSYLLKSQKLKSQLGEGNGQLGE